LRILPLLDRKAQEAGDLLVDDRAEHVAELEAMPKRLDLVPRNQKADRFLREALLAEPVRVVPDERPRPENSRVLRVIKKVLPLTDELHDGKMFVRTKGALTATPLFLALVAIEASDAVFAVDSIFAIFAVTTETFIVLTSNVFAILGLRSLYFVLSGAAERFKYVQPGLALVLVFVGVKMAIADWVKIPVPLP
jgi:TerC family integral membrane protein